MIIVITGPTGVGKTKLSIQLAKRLAGEIINADSMQIYKGLDIGTAKIKEEEKEGIKHHLFDIKEVDEDYSVYQYQQDARKKINELLNNHKIPIIVGGTGLYIKALLFDYNFVKEDIKNEYTDLSNEEIHHRIIEINPTISIDFNNRRRLVRALNKLENGSYIENKEVKLLYDDVKFIGLTTNRDYLYQLIDKRVDNMLDDLVKEVKFFYDKKVCSKAINTGIGYKELYPYFAGNKSLDECVLDIKKNSKHYAKRQYTFLNNQLDIKWFDVNYKDFNETIDQVYKYIVGE